MFIANSIVFNMTEQFNAQHRHYKINNNPFFWRAHARVHTIPKQSMKNGWLCIVWKGFCDSLSHTHTRRQDKLLYMCVFCWTTIYATTLLFFLFFSFSVPIWMLDVFLLHFPVIKTTFKTIHFNDFVGIDRLFYYSNYIFWFAFFFITLKKKENILVRSGFLLILFLPFIHRNTVRVRVICDSHFSIHSKLYVRANDRRQCVYFSTSTCSSNITQP